MNLEALKALAAKVEAGQFISRFDGPEHRVWPGGEGMNSMKRHHARYSYHGSLDAAKALHDAVLPDWTVSALWEVREQDNGQRPTGDWTALLFSAMPGLYLHAEATCKGASRAWLLAILRALIAQEESNG